MCCLDHNCHIFPSDYFTVNPIEVPIHPEFSGSSAPLDAAYKDENVTIYALPIIPMDLAVQSESPPGTVFNAELAASTLDKLKRKRAPSPFLPSKHPYHPQDSSDQVSSSTPSNHATIEDLRKDPNFNPRFLRGEMAQEWRQLLVRAAFRSTHPTPNEQTASKASAGQQGRKVNDLSTTEQGIGSSPVYHPLPQRVVRPLGFEGQLPPFSLPYRKVTNTPETKPTLAYVVVGPRLRGKFDAEKAKALKIPRGPLRGELTRGNAITFMVPNESGAGGMTPRTVQPGEVVGPSECPSVSAAS